MSQTLGLCDYVGDFPWHTTSAVPFRACGAGAMHSKMKIDAIDLSALARPVAVSLGFNLDQFGTDTRLKTIVDIQTYACQHMHNYNPKKVQILL